MLQIIQLIENFGLEGDEYSVSLAILNPEGGNPIHSQHCHKITTCPLTTTQAGQSPKSCNVTCMYNHGRSINDISVCHAALPACMPHRVAGGRKCREGGVVGACRHGGAEEKHAPQTPDPHKDMKSGHTDLPGMRPFILSFFMASLPNSETFSNLREAIITVSAAFFFLIV